MDEAYGFDVAPRPTQTVQPQYPPSAQQSELEGVVLLQVVVGTDGSVSHTEVVDSSAPIFEKPARDAVSQWRFEPAMLAGSPVESTIEIPIQFLLHLDPL